MIETKTMHFKPIPITEQWLLDFGFEIGNNPRNLELFPMQILKTPNGFEYFFAQGFGGKFIIIKHVHQLQNLHFALTQTELILKP